MLKWNYCRENLEVERVIADKKASNPDDDRPIENQAGQYKPRERTLQRTGQDEKRTR